MYTFNIKEQKVYKYNRKVSLLSELMKLKGEVLDVQQSYDPWVTIHAIKEANNNLQIFISNKSRDVNKNISLYIAEVNNVKVKIMGLDFECFTSDTPPEVRPDNSFQFDLDPLSIIKITVERSH